MDWKNLSTESKSILEWAVNPFTNRKEIIEIRIGMVFHMECPKILKSIDIREDEVSVLVTRKIFDEITEYVISTTGYLWKSVGDNGLRFQIKPEIEV